MNEDQNISDYRDYAAGNQLPLFYQPWYLDSVCGVGNWGLAIDRHKDAIRGVWPYLIKQKYGLTYITMPSLTPYLGPYYRDQSKELKEPAWRALEKSIQQNLFQQIPKHLMMISHWHPNINNWMPLHWLGCKQTTRYTYRIDLLQDLGQIQSAITNKQRSAIKQAKANYQIVDSSSASDLWPLIEETYQRQCTSIPFSRTYYDNWDAALQQHQASKIFLVSDSSATQAGIYMAYDHDTAYLMITGRTSGSNAGAVSLGIQQAIQTAKEMGLKYFDFEGSMMEGVERYFRSFGGGLTPYSRVTNTSGKYVELILRMMNRL